MASITTRVVRNARRRGVKIRHRKYLGIAFSVYQWRRKFRKHKLCPKHPADTLWCHISVTHDKPTIKQDAWDLHTIGNERFGSGMSYNFAIDMGDGEIAVGQALDAAGTHTLNEKDIPNYSFNQNYVSHAIVFIGMPGRVPSAAAIESAGKLMAAMVEERALTRHFDFNPHFMVAFKECPTKQVAEKMPLMLKVMERELAKS